MRRELQINNVPIHAVEVVAGQGEVFAAAQAGVDAPCDQFPVGLENEGKSDVSDPRLSTKICGDLAAGAEGRVRAAVGVVAGQREVIGGKLSAPHHQLAIRLENEGDPPSERISDNLATDAEGDRQAR